VRICLVILLCFLGSISNAQVVAFAADKMNVLYVGLENPLTIVVENMDCKDVKIFTTNGKILRKGCKLLIVPDSIGISRITVQTKKNK
jgi:hypothetical protein